VREHRFRPRDADGIGADDHLLQQQAKIGAVTGKRP
jgi:hypothetical protein